MISSFFVIIIKRSSDWTLCSILSAESILVRRSNSYTSCATDLSGISFVFITPNLHFWLWSESERCLSYETSCLFRCHIWSFFISDGPISWNTGIPHLRIHNDKLCCLILRLNLDSIHWYWFLRNFCLLSIVFQPHFRCSTFILEQSIDLANLRSTSRMFLNHIIHVIQNPDDAIWPVCQFSELPTTSSMEFWTIEPNVRIQFEANFTNSLVVTSFGSIKRGLQMITHNAIGFLHSFTNCFGIFVGILICWFRFVEKQVNSNSRFS